MYSVPYSCVYSYYLINIEDENLEDAFFALVHTAWLCDDSDDEQIAKHCRARAIITANKLIADKSIDRDDIEDIYLIKMDLMRRCGYFDELINEYAYFHFSIEKWEDIRRFQIEKAQEENTKRYNTDNVIDYYHPGKRKKSIYELYYENK